MKICTKCRVETPKNMMVQGGFGSWCKKCQKECTQRYRNTDRVKAYRTYGGMLERCYNPKSTRYEKYGKVGIIVDDVWLGENGFENFFEWYKLQQNSTNHEYQLDKDIYCNENRIKPHVYSPKTCKYVKRSENQRNYSSLLKNNTSGYTGISINKNKKTWDFRLHREHSSNINRSGFLSELEAAKSREAFIIVNNLNFKLEHVGTTMNINEKPYENFTYYGSSNYSMIIKKREKFTGTVRLLNGKRKSIGSYNTEKEASDAYSNIIKKFDIEKINKPSLLFGFGSIIKDT